MEPISGDDQAAVRRRRRLSYQIRDSLRDLNSQLSSLSHQVSGQLELRATDLGCLELISRHGPLSPSALARRAGLHPATTTGILDRLERGGWIARERDPADRRGVVVRAVPSRSADVLRLYAGMNYSMDEICADSSADELELLAGFLRRTAEAGRAAADELASS